MFARLRSSRRGASLLRTTAFGSALGLYRRLRRRDGRGVSRQGWPLFRRLVDDAPDAVLVTSADCSIRYANRSAEALLGYRLERLLGTEFSRYVHPGDRERVLRAPATDHPGGGPGGEAAFRLRRADGSWRQVEATIAGLPREASPERGGRVYYARDVSENNAQRESLRRRAFEDPLTGLANRGLFMERLEHALVSNARHGRPVAVLFLDLNDFKAVNDEFGHEAGDRLLTAVGRRLRACTRPGDTAARLGGDEFVVLIEDVAAGTNPDRLAERILGVLEEPVAFEGHTLRVTASIGAAVGGPDKSGADLLRAADAAMYRAKRAGRGRYAVYDGSPTPDAAERGELKSDLRRALERSELRVHYQPMVPLDGGGVVGMEALLRWEHPRLGLLLPEAFVPLAERSGLIVPIGRWLLEEACRQARGWPRVGTEGPVSVNVNLSQRELLQPDLVESVVALDRTGNAPGYLALEITERVFVDGRRMAETLRRLERSGVRLVIDDFGTGYASLPTLARLPIHGLKIDRSFVGMLAGEPDKARPMISATVGIANGLKLGVVAEGVESARQAAELRLMGCGAGQGSYFSEPLPPEAALQYLETSRVRTADGDEVDR